MAERRGLSGCAIAGITGAVVLLLATLVGCGLTALFLGGTHVQPVNVEAEPTPAPSAAPAETR